MNLYDLTPGRALYFAGVGLHGGGYNRLCILPRSTPGFWLRSAQVPGGVSLTVDHVSSTRRCTAVGGIHTVEHVLAALYGLGITAAELVIEGDEFPILDGSALPVVQALQGTTPRRLPTKRRTVVVKHAFELGDGDAWHIRVRPANGLHLHYALDYALPQGGRYALSGSYTPADCFATVLAPARTFVFEREVLALRASGQALGGTLDNALVLNDCAEAINLPRFDNEPLRHKLLDLMGDLALLGANIEASIEVFRGGHTSHVKLVQQLQSLL
jgi:UDP-3-O-[3-hydroxymyristoyl] N-acetylglucosamine deacetylase